MNSTEVFDLIERIAAESSINAKQALLNEHLDDPLVKDVCVNAYDPFRVFFIGEKTIEATRGIAPGSEDWATCQVNRLLESLRLRALTGDGAVSALHAALKLLDAKSGELLRRVLLGDLRAGFGDTLINKVRPGLLPEYPYMRCTLTDKIDLDEWLKQDFVISQEKADGMFANVNKGPMGEVWMTTRQGTPIPRGPLERVFADVERWVTPDTQSHGELVILDPQGKTLPREKGNGMLNSVLKGGQLDEGHSVCLFIWDQIPLDAVKPKGKYTVTYENRLTKLVTQLPNVFTPCSVRLIPTKILRSRKAIFEHFREMLAQGKEGTVVSQRKGIWKDSGSAKEKAKLKLEVVVDLEVIGFLPGTGKNASTFGSLLCATADGFLEVAATGFSDKLRADIWARREQVRGSIVGIKANSIMAPSTPGGKFSLFLPRFEAERMDKRVADSLEDVQRQFNVAMGLTEEVSA